MKKALCLWVVACTVQVFAQWSPQGDKIKTKWASEIDVNNVLPDYPRPVMVRDMWQNLNGLWEYAISELGQEEPVRYDGRILVPFAIESSLSGVMKPLDSKHELWYKRTFTIPESWNGKTILLHFGAVDWKAVVFLNGIRIGMHTGGYTPFHFDITPYLQSGSQELVVKVWDGTDQSYQPRGKQSSKPDGIWYTSVSGIWQTVWLEPVNEKHIGSVTAVPDIDARKMRVKVATENTTGTDKVRIALRDGATVVARTEAFAGQELEFTVPDMKLWSPEDPFLYDLDVELYSGRKLQDKVESYAAMRKISTRRDEAGIVRLQLNNRDCFHFGPLDQGWWPDGLYTAPTDEALLYDIQKTKELGYNMIRKHMKVEPARWYTYCDRIGLLVWQDMPSGDKSPEWQNRTYFQGNEMVRSAESEANFYKEWQEIMDYLMPYPCVAVWVPFNEAWGQFNTEKVVAWTQEYDSSRLVNPASGGNHYHVGDMLDLHNYPAPDLYLYDPDRPTVLGEYGGIGLPMEGHLWQPDRNWGYIQFKNPKEVTDEYIKYADQLKEQILKGFSAAVYTQTTDVEGEVNGLMTYDRKVLKVEKDRIRNVNLEICNSLNR